MESLKIECYNNPKRHGPFHVKCDEYDIGKASSLLFAAQNYLKFSLALIANSVQELTLYIVEGAEVHRR